MSDRVPSRLARLTGSMGRLAILLLAVVGVALSTGAGEPDRWVAPASVTDLHRGIVVPVPQVPPDFTHSEHEAVQCYECHDTRDRHAELLVTTIQDCRACHHAAPRAAPCSRCHTAAEAPTETFEAVRAVAFTVGTRDPSRVLEFPHPAHAQIDCARCHTEGVALAVPANLDCAGCHQEHHTPQSDCASCHAAAPVEVHPPAEAHVTCSGSACHQNVPFQTVPRTRDFCLGCHQDMGEHEAPRACAECHALPAPRPQGVGLQ